MRLKSTARAFAFPFTESLEKWPQGPFDGEIVEVGTPKELFDSPKEERAKKFLSQIL